MNLPHRQGRVREPEKMDATSCGPQVDVIRRPHEISTCRTQNRKGVSCWFHGMWRDAAPWSIWHSVDTKRTMTRASLTPRGSRTSRSRTGTLPKEKEQRRSLPEHRKSRDKELVGVVGVVVKISCKPQNWLPSW